MPIAFALIALAVVILGAIVIASPKNGGSTPTPSATPLQVAAVTKDTPTSPPTVDTPDITGTIRAIADATFAGQTALALSFTSTQMPTRIPTRTSTNIATLTIPPATATFDPNRAAVSTFGARQTETANAIASYTRTFTPTFTSTPTFTATPNYNQTATAAVISENQTVAAIVNGTDTANTAIAVASFTKTFTPTYTPTYTFTPGNTPIPTVTKNKEWTAQTQSFNGVPMVLVPPGCFKIGSDSSDQSDEKNGNVVCMKQPFWIDQFPVWQAQFKQFNGKAARASNFTGDKRPVESITWFEAKAYCEQQRGGRLPTEAEYEYAARGPDDLIYPWGNSFADANVVYSSNSGNQTADVGPGIRASGASWVGGLDMVGNVWEWTSSIYKAYPYDATDGRENNSDTNSARVLRGGSWYDVTNNVRAAFRLYNGPSYVNNNLGFRCVRSY